MKTIQKIVVVLLIIMVAVTIFMPNVARATMSITLSSDTSTTDMSTLSVVIGRLLGFLQVASGLFAVLMIAITGFNYIVSTPEVKEEMKKKMLPIIIGIVLVFGAVSIANFILGVAAG